MKGAGVLGLALGLLFSVVEASVPVIYLVSIAALVAYMLLAESSLPAAIVRRFHGRPRGVRR